MQSAYAGPSLFNLKLKNGKHKATASETRILKHRTEDKSVPVALKDDSAALNHGDNSFCSSERSRHSRRGGTCMSGNGWAIGLGIAAAVLGLAGTIVTIVLTADDE